MADLFDIAVARKLSGGSGGGGGGGSSDFSTAEVTVNLLGDRNIVGLNSSSVSMFDEQDNQVMHIYYDDSYGLPLDKLGTLTQLKVPIYSGYKSDITQITFADSENSMLIIDTSESSVVSGSAEIDNWILYVTGDCVLNLALVYAD